MCQVSAAGSSQHIFFSASRENIFRKYCCELPVAAFRAMRRAETKVFHNSGGAEEEIMTPIFSEYVHARSAEENMAS